MGFVWEVHAAGQEQGLTALSAFKAEYGHCAPPGKYVTDDGFRLGSWCGNRRMDRRKGRLDPELEAALDALGFVWDVKEARRREALQALADFTAEHGHPSPPQKHVTPEGFPLGSWCSSRRGDHRKGQLDPEVEAALDALGFVWNMFPGSRYVASYEEALAALSEFKAEYGHCAPPRKYVTDDGGMRWLSVSDGSPPAYGYECDSAYRLAETNCPQDQEGETR